MQVRGLRTATASARGVCVMHPYAARRDRATDLVSHLGKRHPAGGVGPSVGLPAGTVGPFCKYSDPDDRPTTGRDLQEGTAPDEPERRRAGPGGTTAADDRARPPGRRVEQGCGQQRPLRRRGARRDGRDLHRRRARQHPEPGDGPARRAGRHVRPSAVPRWPVPPRSSAYSTAGSVSSTPGCPRGTRSRRCPRAASRSVTWRSRPRRWCG